MKTVEVDHIKSIVNEEIIKNNLFIVELTVSRLSKISLFVDSVKGVTIEECEKLSRLIEKNLDRDIEDFELEVSSPGLDRPLKLPFQYQKNMGREVEVLKTDGTKSKGKIVSVGEVNFQIEYSIREKVEGTNKKINTTKKETIDFDNVRSTKVIVKF